MSLLEICNLSAYYGQALVLNKINVEVQAKESVGIIGPNGAGKTTLMHCISGVKEWEGNIIFDGQHLERMSPSIIVSLGIVQVPEGRHLFSQLKVRENLKLGAFLRKDNTQIGIDLESVLNLFPRLRERFNQLAGTLSGGEQQMLAIGRALMSSPKLLLMDEPSFGLAPLIKESIIASVTRIRQAGVTILLVEQDVHMAFDLVERLYLLEEGSISLHGNREELITNPIIKSSYLGTD
jgi:branched-chain amino acid transport system ATP-binding protein